MFVLPGSHSIIPTMDIIAIKAAKALLKEDVKGSIKIKRLVKAVLKKTENEKKTGTETSLSKDTSTDQVKDWILGSDKFTLEGKLVSLSPSKKRKGDSVTTSAGNGEGDLKKKVSKKAKKEEKKKIVGESPEPELEDQEIKEKNGDTISGSDNVNMNEKNESENENNLKENSNENKPDDSIIDITSATSNDDVNVDALEAIYREALSAFKANKSNKDLRRAKSIAKRAWDAAVAATQDGEQLKCRNCSQMFIFSTGEKEYYEDKSLDKPIRCKKCSKAEKARRADRSKDNNKKGKNMCRAFQRGECKRGLQCKFSHDPKHGGVKKENDSDEKDDKDENKKDEKDAENKKDIKPIASGVCKWGSNCKLKKCRFSHSSSEEVKKEGTSEKKQ